MNSQPHLDALIWHVATLEEIDEPLLEEILQDLRALLETLPEETKSPASAKFSELDALLVAAKTDASVRGGIKGKLESLLGELDGSESACGTSLTVDIELLEMFTASCGDSLADLEGLLLSCAETQEEGGEIERETLDTIRRIVHTIKGESGVLSLAEAQQIWHTAESMMEAVLEAHASLPIDSLMSVIDWKRDYLELLAESADAPPPPHDGLLQGLEYGAESAEAVAEVIACGDEIITFPPEVLADETLGEFLTEAYQHLEDSEGALLELEADPQSEQNINLVFRAFHTIKGVAGFLNLDPVCALAHSSETFLDVFRSTKADFLPAHADLVLSAKDMMTRLMDALSGQPGPQCDALQHLIAKIDKAAKNPGAAKQGGDRLIIKTLEEAGIKGEAELAEAIRSPVQTTTKLGGLMVERGILSQAQVDRALEHQEELVKAGRPSKLGEVIAHFGFATQKQIDEALLLQGGKSPIGQLLKADVDPTPKSPKAPVQTQSTIRVNTNRLDSLVDLVGELVIAQQMVVQDEALTIRNIDDRLSRNLGHLGKITRDLQEASMSLRMVTFQSTFQKMQRLVRDVASKAGKKVRLVIEGADTEVDRNVVDKISDPLVHLIRNAVDHGLEGPEERAEVGKNPEGIIVLKARHQGGAIVVSVRDNGRGLSRDKILKKAAERGLIPSDVDPADMTDAAVFKLIFQAGFSTAAAVTDISGRGVGMDVVRKNIEAMRGKVDIVSKEGEGTTFLVTLPLTLAIIDGMVVRTEGQRYVIPTLSIVQSFRPDKEQLHGLYTGSAVVEVRDTLVPVRRLQEVLSADRSPAEWNDMTFVLVEAMDRCVCLAVDELLGQQQVVIKNLGKCTPNLPVISGGAILGDGQVALIVDVEGVLAEVECTVQA